MPVIKGKLENSAVTLTAGGRRDWYYDLKLVDVDYAGLETQPNLNNNLLILKGSAGGLERGISMQWALTEDFLLEKLALMHGISGSEIQIINGIIDFLQERKERVISQHFFKLPLSKTEIKEKTMQILKANGLDDVGDIVACTRSELASLPNIGRKTIEEVESMLSSYGMSISQGADDV